MIKKRGIKLFLFLVLSLTLISFVSAETLYGDVNLDGEVTVADAVELTNFIYSGLLLSYQQKVNADVNADSSLNYDDIELITSYVNGEISSFPAESSSSGSSGSSSGSEGSSSSGGSNGGGSGSSITCLEQDAGKNYYVKGGVSISSSGNKIGGNTDYCVNSVTLNEYYCDNSTSLGYGLERYTCPNGCNGGACVNATSNEEDSDNLCTDSDGGLKIEVYGETNEGDSDYCVEKYSGRKDYVSYCEGYNCYVNENYCEDGSSVSVDVSCEDRGYNYCNKGACTNEKPFKELNFDSCGSLIDFFDNPYDFEIDGEKWYAEKSYYYDEGNKRLDFDLVDSYRSSVYTYLEFYDIQDYYGGDLETFFNNTLRYNLCSKSYVGGEEVYSCLGNYDVSSELENKGRTSRTILWVNEGLIFELAYSVYEYGYGNCYDSESCERMYQEEFRQETRSFIKSYEKLLNNDRSDRIYTQDIDWRIKDLLSYFVRACPSDLEIDSCLGSWECKLEPALCPPHGVQTRTCVQNSCSYDSEDNVKVQEIQCSPGVCSGCYVPRWFDATLDNTCIPYGFRFEKQTGWGFKEVFYSGGSDKESLSVSDTLGYSEIDLEVLGNDSAILTLYVGDGKNISVVLYNGAFYNWKEILRGYSNEGLVEELIDSNMSVESINYNSSNYEESNVVLNFIEPPRSYLQEFPETINAYCDFDGIVKEQKTRNDNGDWATCQNNYECESNNCVSGECIDVNAIARDVAGYQEWGVKLLCRFADLFFIDNYESCVVERLGEGSL